MVITAEQVRAARGFVGWSQSDLAQAANIGRVTISDFEAGKRRPRATSLNAIRAALEAASVEFTNGDKPGVRMGKPSSGAAVIATEDLNASNDQ
jgi:transcriptional regulator with XRE-family HTH domain